MTATDAMTEEIMIRMATRKLSRASIASPERTTCLVQPIHLDKSIAGPVLVTAHDCGITAGRQGSGDSGFQVVARSQTRSGDDAFLVFFPIVVKENQAAVAVIERQ